VANILTRVDQTTTGGLICVILDTGTKLAVEKCLYLVSVYVCFASACHLHCMIKMRLLTEVVHSMEWFSVIRKV
jgi:Na+/H+-dicarboxylate symporter